MKYIAFWNTEKIKVTEINIKKSVEKEFNFTTFPNIPTVNFIDEEFIDSFRKQIMKMTSILNRLFTTSNEIVRLKHDDFTTDEIYMLLSKLITLTFRKAYIIEKSRLLNHMYKNESDQNYLCIYFNERNCIIAKVIKTAPVEIKILPNHLTIEISLELEKLRKENPYLRVYSDNPELSDEIIGEDEIIRNLIFMARSIFKSRTIAKRFFSLVKTDEGI